MKGLNRYAFYQDLWLQVAASIVASISTEAVNTTLAQINASVDTMIGQEWIWIL